MLPNWKPVELLQAVQKGPSSRQFSGLEYVAEAALNIIKDTHLESVTDFDANVLVELIHEIWQTECCDGDLEDYLRADLQDCAICRAVSNRLYPV